ncbi:MAG: hypothetical protein NVSMB16_14250 [Acidimicrobiales bacterium]
MCDGAEFRAEVRRISRPLLTASSAGFEMVSEGLSDDLGHRYAFVLCPASEAFFEVGIEPDRFNG